MPHQIEMLDGHVALVDDADAELVRDHLWRANRRYDNGERIDIIAVVATIDGEIVALHRLLLGAPAGSIVDHIDGDPLNNTRANLRYCSHAENMRNRRRHRNNRSGAKGVYRAGSRWRACIKLHGRTIHLGSFQSIPEAADAYASAAIKYHGEFARTA